MSESFTPSYLKNQKTRKVRVWGKGQFTIPAEIRERLDIKEDSYLEVFQVGRAIVLTPERLVVKELADSFQKEMNKNGIDLEQLLQELREGSHEYETD
ncbi:MAG: AbrB family transcriptional regulator [Peptococcaceae bacterium BRH_c4b]|nr:MAG: AbrB family transcriptional regulator [Peptococcaceae bacterium BRH_c4b]